MPTLNIQQGRVEGPKASLQRIQFHGTLGMSKCGLVVTKKEPGVSQLIMGAGVSPVVPECSFKSTNGFSQPPGFQLSFSVLAEQVGAVRFTLQSSNQQLFAFPASSQTCQQAPGAKQELGRVGELNQAALQHRERSHRLLLHQGKSLAANTPPHSALAGARSPAAAKRRPSNRRASWTMTFRADYSRCEVAPLEVEQAVPPSGQVQERAPSLVTTEAPIWLTSDNLSGPGSGDPS